MIFYEFIGVEENLINFLFNLLFGNFHIHFVAFQNTLN